MRYVFARFNARKAENELNFYITDALRLITENTAKFAGGSYIQVRYADIIKPKPVETRTAKEIIADLSKKLDRIGKM